MSDYQEAVQAPTICFPDSELKRGTPFMNKLGLPRPICGQFASVYEIETGGSRYAVKCFLRNIPDQHGRYARISEHLHGHKTPYFVTFEYQNEGIRVQGELRPLVKMQWIEGLALNEFIETNLSNPSTLAALEGRWLDLLADLRAADIAHGDLQHGNVIVAEDGSLRLIDYDGMWVPALEGQTSHETGHPDFQSPLRTDRYFHAGIDLFAGAAIQIAMRALSKQPELWSRYNNGDNLLFRRQDYLNPAGSALFAELKALKDEVIDERLKVLVEACAALPKLEECAARADGNSGTRKSSEPDKSRKVRKREPKKVRREKAKKVREERRKAREEKKKAREEEANKAREEKAKKGSQLAKPTTASQPAKSESSPGAVPPGPGTTTQAPPPNEKKSSSWLTDHVTRVAAPAEASPPKVQRQASPPGGSPPSKGETPKKPETNQSEKQTTEAPQVQGAERGPGFLRFFLHMVVLAPVAVPAIAEWFDFLGIDATALTRVQEVIVNTTMVLGVLSLTTLLIFRTHHRWASALFFGVTVLVSVYDLSTKLWTIGSPTSIEENLYYFGFSQLLLISSGLGWVLPPPTVAMRPDTARR